MALGRVSRVACFIRTLSYELLLHFQRVKKERICHRPHGQQCLKHRPSGLSRKGSPTAGPSSSRITSCGARLVPQAPPKAAGTGLISFLIHTEVGYPVSCRDGETEARRSSLASESMLFNQVPFCLWLWLCSSLRAGPCSVPRRGSHRGMSFRKTAHSSHPRPEPVTRGFAPHRT